MSLINVNHAAVLKPSGHPNAFTSALGGYGVILLLCIGCIHGRLTLCGVCSALIMSSVMQGCQAEVTDEPAGPWVIGFTLVLGLLLGLGLWVLLLTACRSSSRLVTRTSHPHPLVRTTRQP